MSRTRLYGSTNGIPFHRSTMTLLDAPMPIATRPGAASANAAIDVTRVAGPRVNAGTIAVPRQPGTTDRHVVDPRRPHARGRARHMVGDAVVVGLAGRERARPRHRAPAGAAVRAARRARHRLRRAVPVDDLVVPRGRRRR